MSKVIMTIDDSLSMRQMVSFTLKQAGYDVLEAVDGADALEKIEGAKVDLFLTDLNMPNMDGIELIKVVRKRAEYKFVPIIMLTTESEASKRAAGKEAGATGWLVKPFKADQLIKVVKKVLR
jgi:two-component system chemotaxis response regulator CheY